MLILHLVPKQLIDSCVSQFVDAARHIEIVYISLSASIKDQVSFFCIAYTLRIWIPLK